MDLRRRTARNEEPEVIVTSFIDVLLLLLIFFMVSTTFVDEAHMQIRLPDAATKADSSQRRDTIEVTVTQEGTYRVNGKALINASPQTLSAAIANVAGERRDLAVTIRADARTTHQSVVTAMDVLGRLGFKAINIATINEPAAAAPTRIK
jgi:biopolymer transport protein ExbD